MFPFILGRTVQGWWTVKHNDSKHMAKYWDVLDCQSQPLTWQQPQNKWCYQVSDICGLETSVSDCDQMLNMIVLKFMLYQIRGTMHKKVHISNTVHLI